MSDRPRGYRGEHRATQPKPGEPGWSHPDVAGETDPAEIKAQLDAITNDEARRRQEIMRRRHR